LKYSIAEPEDGFDFYVPEILRGDKELEREWLEDLESLRENFPQAILLDITETGNLDDFLLKAIERRCSCVFLETNLTTKELTQRYYEGLVAGKHPRADELKAYTRGARCTFPRYKCEMPCGFSEAVNETRKISILAMENSLGI
jgi:hypothetical protein